MKPSECYRVLGLPPNAPLSDVRRAYKRLVWEFHPDRAQDPTRDTNQFSRITAAYHTLRSIAPRRTTRSVSIDECPLCGDIETLYARLEGGRQCSACLLAQRRKRLPMPPIKTVRCFIPIALLAVATLLLIQSARSGSETTSALCLANIFTALAFLTRDVLRSVVS
ncbi:MAG: DnaJ domain-containing protein [Phycisphaerae bacterium]|nr:DnaJ domain-containing protein [Phycisphaerae bacterium]